VADGWCWFVLREKYCWLVGDGWFILREKYCWLVADKPNEQGVVAHGRGAARIHHVVAVGDRGEEACGQEKSKEGVAA
jgi:hypothetical protein